jgi:hypothetical protein
LLFTELGSFDFLEQCPIVSIFEDHICYLSVLINLVVKELNDFGMRKFIVKNDLIFSQFINL